MFEIDWREIFIPHKSLIEVFVRGSIMYCLLFVLLRFLPKRNTGNMGISDLLVVVLIADAAQNGMSGDYRSITEGIVLVATILFWDYLLDWLDFTYPRLRVAGAAPSLLVKQGVLIKKNMRTEKITEEELLRQLREHGVEDLKQVKKAYLEGDGRLSVIKKDRHDS